MAQEPASPPGDDSPEEALNAARARFLTQFRERTASMSLLVDTIDEASSAGALRQIAHRMAGLAGMVGLPRVSDRAGVLEALVRAIPDRGVDREAARRAVDELRLAFEQDAAAPAPVWATPAAEIPAKILLFEDDPDQRRLFVAGLEAAGHRVVTKADGSEALATARAERPAVILLDVELPGENGYAICRRIKADPNLASVPVIFLTARASIDDRLAGLVLGADDYLTKPVDMRELQLRIGILLRCGARRAAAGSGRAVPGVLDYDSFLLGARESLVRAPCLIGMVRAPGTKLGAVLAAILQDVRRRDLVGRYDERHGLLCFPDLPAAAATSRLLVVLEALAHAGIVGVCVGLATGDAGTAIDVLVGQADEALTEARYLGQPVAVGGARRIAASPPRASTTAVLAEDDPDVMRIVDVHLRAADFRTILAFDGERALQAVRVEAPDVLVLDLMMPKLSGFEVLRALRTLDPRPWIVVVSARGREDDVTRAFDLGADDYLTKPFSPQELLARIARLLR